MDQSARARGPGQGTGSAVASGRTLTWMTGLEGRLSPLGPVGETGPEEFRGWGREGILAPGESCMLASCAAYNCCKEEAHLLESGAHCSKSTSHPPTLKNKS